MFGRQIVSNRRGGNATFSHCVADLVQPQHDIASRIQARNRRPLMLIDDDTSFVRPLGADFPREIRQDGGAQRRVDGVKRQPSFVYPDLDGFCVRNISADRTIDDPDIARCQLLANVSIEFMWAVR